MRFGEYCQERGYLSLEQLTMVLTLSRYRKSKIGRLMVEVGFLSVEDLDRLLVDYLVPFCGLRFEEIRRSRDLVQLGKKEESFLSSLGFVAYGLDLESIELVAAEFNDQKIQQVEARFGRAVKLALVDMKVLQLLLPEANPQRLAQQIVVAENLSSDQKLEEPDAYAQIVKDCMQAAKALRASDIHCEPFADEMVIRFRVHGLLADWKKLGPRHIEPLTSKLKWVFNMDLATVGQPQDSRATFGGLGMDVRASSMPVTSGGEKLVMRLIYHDQKFSLKDLSLDEDKLQILLSAIEKKDGLILISGPTGSGKTTTLYALLEEMDRRGKNISTLENPVEKRLPRVNQAHIHDHQDFHLFQRALMRQDPDVILLGEIRDIETADLGMKLASTGHLVLSTVHANGAKEVIDRLLNLGVDRYSLATNLRLSIAQRLVRKICEHCSLPASEDLRRKVWHEGDELGTLKVFNPAGCQHCQGGVIGRMAVIEYLGKDEIQRIDAPDFTMPTTLRIECLKLANRGLIDINEVLAHS